ncbi:hypothetical protein ABE61_22170 [Lysinibacillus sphaericus]|uniref:DUF2339 domain-containing protein n=1 Tax=Lysinibacillus sphaericus TaxID=1421 RepID=UPI0018CEB626|nr:DUF2339 domain-containing protein [Lysinibacillus sphaericus]MBG9456637.1 hypothetical protein [Lysinibacillus sphaericus]MBG9480036.1 hypothetical protein [Lysinibacillus sphaericus]MBG9594248.1 hypothetical protein [Lysinibacillus sphaericus]
MSLEMERRVAKLEQEMMDLRQELEGLKRQQPVEKSSALSARQSMVDQFAPKPAQILKPNSNLEPKPEIMTNSEEKVQPQRTLEERIMWALPKLFMVILVMGVLWGLKLVSDYGYLANEVKIILAYVLSLALVVIAYVLERKKTGSPAITISLYGGAFIVGILTTAASAILYEIIGLTMALVIAVVYIGYGIVISYLKKNEVLTIFVAFTSLLLPYLLEYMDFSPGIILIYVVVLFMMLQFVILQHKQKLAFYLATFFSLLAVSIIAFMNHDNRVVFAIGFLVVLTIFYTSWCRLYNAESKLKNIHVGLQFSLGTFSLLLLNFIIRPIEYSEVLLLIVVSLFAAVAGYGYKQKWQEAFDSAVTLAFITLCNTLLVMNLPGGVDQLLIPFITFAGVMMSLRLRASMMKVVGSFSFTITVALNFIIHEPTPLFSIDHISLIMPGIYLLIIYVYARRPKETLTSFEKFMKEIYVVDILAVITAGYFLAYIGKLDELYFASVGNIPHLTCLILALLFAGSLLVPTKYKGRALTPVLGGFFVLFTVMLEIIPYNMQGVEWLNIVTRIVYIAVIVAIMIDVLMKGRIYQIYQEQAEKHLDQIVSAGVVLTMISVWGLIHQLSYNSLLDWKLSIAFSTITLFLTASISLWLSTVRNLQTLRLTGFVILVIAFIKLIFFDLSALDLLIRAVLFILIGGIGLLLSGRLLKK